MECPKCQHIRIASDPGPSYECPKCGIVYAKFDSAVEERDAALRVKLAGRKQHPTVLTEQTPNLDDAQPSQVSSIAKFRAFVKAPKRRLTKSALWCGLLVLVFILLRFTGEVGLWILFLAPLLLLLLKQQDPGKVKNCPACNGLVAYGVKSCPHCGKSKPAPKPVGKTTVAIAWVFMGMMVIVGSKSPGSSSGSSGPNPADDPAVRLGAQATVQAAGYRCGTVTHMTKLLIGRGFSVHCDNYRDNYSITDEGGRIHVRLD